MSNEEIVKKIIETSLIDVSSKFCNRPFVLKFLDKTGFGPVKCSNREWNPSYLENSYKYFATTPTTVYVYTNIKEVINEGRSKTHVIDHIGMQLLSEFLDNKADISDVVHYLKIHIKKIKDLSFVDDDSLNPF